MLLRVFVRENAGAGRVEPGIAAGVVEMPMGINELADGLGTDTCQHLGNRGTRPRETGIDQQLSVPAGKHHDIAPGTHENADVTAQPLHRNLGRGGVPKRRFHKTGALTLLDSHRISF